jgi:hypothetical protein
MREILTSLRNSFQFIVIDSPPAVAITDAAVLSVMSDGVILVFHGRKTTTEAARRLIERMDAVHAPVLGVVLNSVDFENPHFAYYGPYQSYYSHEEENVDASNNRNGMDGQTSHRDGGTEITPSGNLNDEQKAADSTQNSAEKERIEGRCENDSSTASDLTNSLGPFGAVATDIVKEHSLEGHPGAELIPLESLNRLVASVTKSIGSIAPRVVHEQMARLGESYSAFPKRRMAELVKLLQQEIAQRTNTVPVQSSVRSSRT